MNIVRKLNRADRYDIDGTQRWLEELAAQGLHLTHWGVHWSKFQRGEPAKVRYRLDPGRITIWDAKLSQETREDYEEMGWRYVCTAGGAFHIFRADDPQAPELFTDPASQALAMKRSVGQARLNLFWSVVLFLVILLWVWTAFHGGLSAAAIETNVSLVFIFLWMFYIPFSCCEIYRAFYLLRTCQALEQGRSVPRSPRWHRRLNLGYAVYSLLLCASMLLSTWQETLYMPLSDYYALADVPISVPALAELENRPDFILDEFREGYGYGFHPEEGTYAQPETSLLAPVQYTIVQTGRDKTVFWQELLPAYAYNMRYDPSLRIELWETRGASLARTLLEEKLEQTQRSAQYVLAQDLTGEGFDQVLLYRRDDGCACRLFLQKGPRAAVVQYHGAQDLADHLAPFLALMEADWALP